MPPHSVPPTLTTSCYQEGWGYDFRRNMTVAWEDYGSYATDVFTREAERVIRGHDTSNPLYAVLLSAM